MQEQHIPFLDTNAMEWTVGEMPGLFTKMLRSNPETGARTALQRIDPAFGYQPPQQPHYHDGDEEIFLLKGCFSFDQISWLGPTSYCFHPANTVHGFRSYVKEESWFLSRVRKPLRFFFSEEMRDLKPFNLSGTEPERGVSVVPDPKQREWEQVKDADGQVLLERLILSIHPTTGEGSMLVRFMPGWVSKHGTHKHSVYEECYVVEGELLAIDGTRYTAGCYSYKPAGAVQPALASPKGALVYVNFGGPLDFLPA